MKYNVKLQIMVYKLSFSIEDTVIDKWLIQLFYLNMDVNGKTIQSVTRFYI